MTGQPPEIRLGNDIARQFAHLPEGEAAREIASHLEKFWEARMIAALMRTARADDPDVDPLLVHALSYLIVDSLTGDELAEPSPR